MPESVTDRPTKAHEYLFLLSKSPRYFYDADAIREGQPSYRSGPKSLSKGADAAGIKALSRPVTGRRTHVTVADSRNKRSVWTVTTQPYAEAHFATFPPKLIEPCVLAGTSPEACRECAAPWQRIVERETTKEGESYEARMAKVGDHFTPLHQPNRSAAQVPARYDLSQSVTTTKGWAPTCDHDAPGGASTVLDPFAGAGTTGPRSPHQQRRDHTTLLYHCRERGRVSELVLSLEPVAVGREEAAAALGVSPDHFDRHIRGELRTIKVGQRVLYAGRGAQALGRRERRPWRASPQTAEVA
jgi:hypothetical protein